MKDVMKAMDQAVEPELYSDQKATEAALLATLATVINSDLADLKYDILGMTAADFHFRDHRDIFKAMKELADAGDHVDQVTVRARIGERWTETLAAVFDAKKANAGAAPSYKRLIRYRAEIGQAREIGAAFMTALDQAEGKEADLPGLVAGLQKTVFDMARTDRIAPPVMNEAELTDRFVLGLANPSPGYKTGFGYLEEIIRGGLTPGLYVIAAPPSAGKTTFAKQLADQVAELNDAPVLFFSYEQSADELRIKSLARISKLIREPVINEDIKEGKTPDRIEKAAREYKRFARWIKVIEGDRYLTVDKIRLLAGREKQLTGKAPLLVIDYLQIIPVADSGKDKRVEIDYLVSDLRRIAREIGTPVIAISAMSRAEYTTARMTGFKESGGIEYGADIAAILTVEGETGADRAVKLNIIKNRTGRRGFVEMQYAMNYDYLLETGKGFVNYLDTIGKDTGQ